MVVKPQNSQTVLNAKKKESFSGDEAPRAKEKQGLEGKKESPKGRKASSMPDNWEPPVRKKSHTSGVFW